MTLIQYSAIFFHLFQNDVHKMQHKFLLFLQDYHYTKIWLSISKHISHIQTIVKAFHYVMWEP